MGRCWKLPAFRDQIAEAAHVRQEQVEHHAIEPLVSRAVQGLRPGAHAGVDVAAISRRRCCGGSDGLDHEKACTAPPRKLSIGQGFGQGLLAPRAFS